MSGLLRNMARNMGGVIAAGAPADRAPAIGKWHGKNG